MQAIRKVGSRRCRDYVLVFPLLFCGFVDQTALRTLALDPGDARSRSIADLTAPEIPDNDPGLGSFGDDGLFRRSETGKTLVAKATHDLSGRWPVRLAANVRILATASPTTTGRVMSESWKTS